MAVDETSGGTSTSYQESGILRETRWAIFTIRAEEGSNVKSSCFCIYVCFFVSFPFAVVVCHCIICCVECRHSTSHGSLVASRYVYFVLCFVRTTTVPDTWLLAYVCFVLIIAQHNCSGATLYHSNCCCPQRSWLCRSFLTTELLQNLYLSFVSV